jgi:tRNA G18 (ribose-2'-O)-methylase SpoU
MARIVFIDRADDPRIADYVAIRERDLTGRDGKFIVEGKVTLNILLTRSRFAVESMFVSESRLGPLSEILAAVPEGVPIYVAPQDVMNRVAGFDIHRGVLACARKGAGLALGDLVGARTLLVLNNISNHDNVGAAFRNAAAFGADGIVLDERSCDPLYRKAIRVSAGSSLWLPYVQAGDGAGQIAALHDAGFEVWAMTPRETAEPLHEVVVPDKVAVLLGAEGTGLPDDLIAAARPVAIPMQRGFDSVNVATAGAIALSHVFNARQMG